MAFADKNRIGMYGVSRGAVMTYLALTKVSWIKAVCICSGLANMIRNVQMRPEMQDVFNKRFGGSVEDMKKRSVVFWTEKLPKNVPILIIHGTKDERVSIEDAMETDKKMTEFGIPHKLVLFPGADHFLTGFEKEKNKLVLDWFNSNFI